MRGDRLGFTSNEALDHSLLTLRAQQEVENVATAFLHRRFPIEP